LQVGVPATGEVDLLREAMRTPTA
jgi:hypothetical protein